MCACVLVYFCLPLRASDNKYKNWIKKKRKRRRALQVVTHLPETRGRHRVEAVGPRRWCPSITACRSPAPSLACK